MKNIFLISLMAMALKAKCQNIVTIKDENSTLVAKITIYNDKKSDNAHTIKIDLSNGSDSFRQELKPTEFFSFNDGQSGNLTDQVRRAFKFDDLNFDNKTDLIINNYIGSQLVQGIPKAIKTSVWLSNNSDFVKFNKQYSKAIAGNNYTLDKNDNTLKVFQQSSISANSYGYDKYMIQNNKLTYKDGIFISVAGQVTNDLDKRQVIFTKLENGKKIETKKILNSEQLEELEKQNELRYDAE